LINFDMPWNPSKVEQRIGRIDRMGQAHPELPIVNLYLKGSVDQTTVIEAFPVEDAVEPPPEAPLIGPDDTKALLAALDGTGIEVRAETNTRHLIGDGPLRIVTDGSAVAFHLEASCIDGLDLRQWSLLRLLQRPGERLPLLLVNVECDAFRVMTCGWVGTQCVEEVNSFADVKRLVAEWDGNEPAPETWNRRRLELEERTGEVIERLQAGAKSVAAWERLQQREAARLRVIEELGRLLVCFPPDTDDLNGKFHRFATGVTPTADRLKAVYNRLGAYPEWSSTHWPSCAPFGVTSRQPRRRHN
jgi:hypothetical protein